MNLGPYQKTMTALVTGLIGWGFVVVSSNSGPITSSEWMGLAVAVATALGVYAVANVPPPGEESDPALSEQDPPE